MTVLTLSGVEKRFGPTVALDGVSLQLRKGEVHALIGENGAGKSTLMNVLAGSVRADAGTMEIEGQLYAPASPLEARNRGIALIHQELSLCPHLTVAENILLGIETSRMGWLDRKSAHARAREVLETFDHPELRPETRAADLSLPAQQIVEICRAIAARARIILMDEPTSSLQRNDVARLFRLINKLKADGVSIVYISHFLEEVREVADTFTVLRDGHSVAAGEIASATDEELIARMVGRSVENLFPHRPPVQAREDSAVLSVQDLVAKPGLKHASFELRRGEILGIAGLMGSGRTEMLRALFGLEIPDSGTIALKGKLLAVRGSTPAMRLLQRVGYLSEDRKGEGLALSLSIADNMTITSFSSCARWGWLDLEEQRLQSANLIKELGVKARAPGQLVRTLSGGNQQKVALARLLFQNADVLLLDEPTRGIDIGSKVTVYETIAQCAARGKAILMVSSYLPELFGMCDRLAVMSRGRLSASRPVLEWTPESVMQAAVGAEETTAA